MPNKLRNVVDAMVIVLKKFLKPKKFIGVMYMNTGPQEQPNDLSVVRKGTKSIKYKPTIFFLS